MGKAKGKKLDDTGAAAAFAQKMRPMLFALRALSSMAAAPVLTASGIDELIGERNDVGARDGRTLLGRDIVVCDRT
jgi:hypothetical protein